MITFDNKPYFMTNKDWYEYDLKKGIYTLTKEAPEKAIESYNEFYKTTDITDPMINY